jgi:hypothetical protein
LQNAQWTRDREDSHFGRLKREALMNGRTGAVTTGREISSRGGLRSTSGARPAHTGGGQRPAAGDWPLFSGLGPLGALPTAPRLTRTFAVMVLGGWGMEAMAEAGELIVSELATNVVRAASGPDGHPRYDDLGRLPVLWVRLMSDRARLRIEVWDTLPAVRGTPVVRRAAPDEESGRGLDLVAAISLDWGWEPVPGRQAKRVWAVLAVPVQERDVP